MKIDGYKFLSEFFSKQSDEKILKRYPFVSITILKGTEVKAKKKLFARLVVTNKKLVIDGLSTLVAFPIPKSTSLRKIEISDAKVFYKKVKEFEIPYEYLKGIEFSEEDQALKIQTLLDHNLILIKGRNIEKISDEVIKTIRPFVKHYARLK